MARMANIGSQDLEDDAITDHRYRNAMFLEFKMQFDEEYGFAFCGKKY
ncbi:MAG: hypothetical protein NC543_10985 [bacterium]|nr:hypothetical protein [bacterium]MCM1374663.1 hypothetical protein [Muribaculum sp.]